MSKAQNEGARARLLLAKMKRLLPRMKKEAATNGDTMAIYEAAKELKSEIGNLHSEYYYSVAKDLLIDINYASVPYTAEIAALSEQLKATPDNVVKAVDSINPQHYTGLSVEPIDAIESWGLSFHLGNTVKYIVRAGRKTPDTLIDLRKAEWYLKRKIANLEKEVVNG